MEYGITLIPGRVSPSVQQHGERWLEERLLVVRSASLCRHSTTGGRAPTITALATTFWSSSSTRLPSLGSAGGCVKIDDIHRLNVCEMLNQGVPVTRLFSTNPVKTLMHCVSVFYVQDHEILNAWLTDLGFEEYYDLFVQAGYDMHTITRMTPEVNYKNCLLHPH